MTLIIIVVIVIIKEDQTQNYDPANGRKNYPIHVLSV